MSPLLPLLLSAMLTDVDHFRHPRNHNFGIGLLPEQLLAPSPFDFGYNPLAELRSNELLYRQLTDLIRHHYGSGLSTESFDKNEFKIILDVQQFTPEEITVKVVDRTIEIRAKHEEKKDEHGSISRQFVRKYVVPDRVDIDKLTSNISSDGVLTITAPLKEVENKSNERTIAIERTGKPARRPETKEDKKKELNLDRKSEETTTEGTTTTTTTSSNPTESTQEVPIPK